MQQPTIPFSVAIAEIERALGKRKVGVAKHARYQQLVAAVRGHVAVLEASVNASARSPRAADAAD